MYLKGPVRQNSISVRDLFPAAYARSSAACGKPEPAPGTDRSTANHVPPRTGPAGALMMTIAPQIVCNSPSHYSPFSSTSNKSTASPDR